MNNTPAYRQLSEAGVLFVLTVMRRLLAWTILIPAGDYVGAANAMLPNRLPLITR